MGDTVIQVDGLSKQYRLGVKGINSLRGRVVEGMRKLGRGSDDEEHPRSFWALRDVSFQVRQGEVLGIIGRNGAGKSTLLKILSRIVEPTEGRIEIHGRVGSLLEVGTGFHPELTGRENIYLNGAILGMKKAEIRRKFDEIVDFAGISKFIDTPVKRYSSGMYVRLAFAVAAHLEPEILIVDEALAVGDVAFQQKCLGKMQDVVESEGRTILFVSHNMQAVRGLCKRGVLLDQGRVKADTGIYEAVLAYNQQLRGISLDSTTSINDTNYRRGSGEVRFTSISILNADNEQTQVFGRGDMVRLAMSYEVFEPVNHLCFSLQVQAGESGETITSTAYVLSGEPLAVGYLDTFVLELPDINLRSGEYLLYFWLGDDLSRPFDVVDNITPPLIIRTDRTSEESEYNSAGSVGYFDIRSKIIRRSMHQLAQ